MPATITERRYDGGFFVTAEGQRSCDGAVVANATNAEVTHSAGLVMARQDIGAISAAKASGTGNGAVTAPTMGARTQVGTYVLTCINASADGGTFSVMTPSGERLPDVTVGAAYTNPHLAGLTVADGSTDWGAGAVINVVVAAGNGQLVPFTNAAGLPAVGILHGRTTVPATGTAKATLVARDAEVNLAELVWDASLSGGALTAARAAAAVSLAAAGIILR